MDKPEGAGPAAAERRRRLVFLLSGLLDIGLAAVIGLLGLEFVDGAATFDRIHMIGAGLLVVMGVATIWCGRAPKARDDAGSVFKVEG